MNNSSALMHLAWSAMSEESIVGKLAAECIKKRLSWTRGKKGLVYAIVNKAPTIRGDKQRRLEAVIAKIPQIEALRAKRRYNRSINWSAYKPRGLGTRRRLVAERYIDLRYLLTCHILKRWRGHTIMVVTERETLYLYIHHPNGSMSRIVTLRSTCRSFTNLTAFLTEFFSPKEVNAALMRGDRISFDFCRMATVVHRREGGCDWYFWHSNSSCKSANREDRER